MLSFHFLNYGPQAKTLPQSAFSASWEGHLTPDCSGAAVFQLTTNGDGPRNATLSLDGVEVLAWSDAQGPTMSLPVPLVRRKSMRLRFTYSQSDQTGTHPGIALQWSVQGADAMQAALEAVAAADAVVVAVGGGTSVTSGEGVDRASLGLPGQQLAFLQAVREASMGKPLATVIVQGKALGEPWVKQVLPAVL